MYSVPDSIHDESDNILDFIDLVRTKLKTGSIYLWVKKPFVNAIDNIKINKNAILLKPGIYEENSENVIDDILLLSVIYKKETSNYEGLILIKMEDIIQKILDKSFIPYYTEKYGEDEDIKRNIN